MGLNALISRLLNPVHPEFSGMIECPICMVFWEFKWVHANFSDYTHFGWGRILWNVRFSCPKCGAGLVKSVLK
jgi:hypothetical protein